MVICHVWDSEYPWDVRAEKVSLMLTEAGHEVHLVARNRDGRPQVEDRPEATVHRMGPLPFGGRALNAVSMFPAFFNPRWIRLIHRIASETRADLILCRDLPLAPTAILVGRRLGIPVVLDMAENYPAMMQAIWDHGRTRPLDALVRNPAIVRRVEEWVLRRIDHVVVVVEESGERLVAMGLSPKQITVASNTPVSWRIPDEPAAPPLTPPLRLVYIGLLESPRGLDVVIDALALCRDLPLPVHCSIVGDGRDQAVLEERARAAGLSEDEIRFHGRLPYDEALAVVRSCHVGIVPHRANPSWNSTIPNKLFDYMSFGIPVITSDARPAARVVRETGSGCVYESHDPADLVRAIVKLTSEQRRREMGASGRQAVLDHYRWTKDGARMVHALERLVADA